MILEKISKFLAVILDEVPVDPDVSKIKCRPPNAHNHINLLITALFNRMIAFTFYHVRA